MSLTQPFITTTRGGNRGAENQGQQRPKRWKDDFWRHGAPTSVFPIPWRTPSQADVPQNHRKSPDFEDPPKLDTNSSFESCLLIWEESFGSNTSLQHGNGTSLCTTRTSAKFRGSANVIVSLVKRPTTRTQSGDGK